ncbi:MAG: hypothetical protein ABIS37_04620 [Bacteroidia bacterium]
MSPFIAHNTSEINDPDSYRDKMKGLQVTISKLPQLNNHGSDNFNSQSTCPDISSGNLSF